MRTTGAAVRDRGPGRREPVRRVAPVAVESSEDNVTGVAGVALFSELLGDLGLDEVADRRNLRPISPGSYCGVAYYRALGELQLAGGDVRADVSLQRTRRRAAVVATKRCLRVRRSSASSREPTSGGPCEPGAVRQRGLNLDRGCQQPVGHDVLHGGPTVPLAIPEG